jgi:hypothetical protein
MSSFGLPLPEPTPQEEKWQDALKRAVRSLDYVPENFQRPNVRELEAEQRFAPEESPSFGTKLYNAFAEETVTGQLISDIGDPVFPRTNYYPTDEEKVKFGGNLSPEIIDRIASETGSFEEFLYELDNARLTEKRRQELYSGGATGFATGMALTMIASGGEAAVAAALIGAATGGVGAPAAAGSTALNAANAARKATRTRAILKAVGSAAAVDIPLEGVRYQTDKTLTPTDLLINLGASTVLSGGIASVFPQMFVGPMGMLTDTAKIQQAAEAAAKAGDTKTAQALNNLLRPRVRVRSLVGGDPSEEVMGMDLATLRKEAKKYGIDISERYWETTTVIDPVTGQSRVVETRRIPNRKQDIENALRRQDEPPAYVARRMANPEDVPRSRAPVTTQAVPDDLQVPGGVQKRPTQPVSQDLQVPGLYEQRFAAQARKQVDDELEQLGKQIEEEQPPLQLDTASQREKGIREIIDGAEEEELLKKNNREALRELEKESEERAGQINDLESSKEVLDTRVKEAQSQVKTLEEQLKNPPRAFNETAGRPATKAEIKKFLKSRIKILKKYIEAQERELFDIRNQINTLKRDDVGQDLIKSFKALEKQSGSLAQTRPSTLNIGSKKLAKILNVLRRVERDPEVVVEVLDDLKGTEYDPFAALRVKDKAPTGLEKTTPDTKTTIELETKVEGGVESSVPVVRTSTPFNDRQIRLNQLERYYKDAKNLVSKRKSYVDKKKKLLGEQRRKELEQEYIAKLSKTRRKADREMLRRDYQRRLKADEKIAAQLEGVRFVDDSGVPVPGPKDSSGVTTAGPDLTTGHKLQKYTTVQQWRWVDEQKIRDQLVARKMLERIGEQTKANRAVKGQVERKWDQLGRQKNGKASRRRYATVLGVDPALIKAGGDVLKRATIQAAIKAAKRGYAIVGEVGKPKGVAFPTAAVIGKVRYDLAGNAEQMLWKLATARGKNSKEAKSKIISYLKERGIEDPEKLAKEFKARVKQNVKEIPEGRSRIYVADLAEMELESARRVRPDGTVYKPEKGDSLFGERREIDFKVDADLVDEAADSSTFKGTNIKKDDPDVDPNDIDDLNQKDPEDVEEAIITDDKNEPVAAGDSDDADAVNEFMRTPENYDTPNRGGTLATESDQAVGFRSWLANKMDRFGKVPGLSLIPWVGDFFYSAFTPVVYRFLNSKSDKVRRVAAIFFDDPRGHGQSSVMAIARVNFERITGALQEQMAIAGEAARRQGRKLMDRDIIRMARSGKEFDGPEGIAVNALRDFYKKILKYAKEEGLPVDNIPDDISYVTRAWNPSKFRAIVEKLGGGEKGRQKVTNFLAEAILAKNSGNTAKLTEKQAKAVAKRIAEFLNNPEAKRSFNNSVTTLDSLKKQLVEELSDIQDDALAEAGGVVGLAEDLIGIIARNHTDAPNLSFGRSRINLDELFSKTIDGVEVHIDELMDMDLNLLTRRYAHQAIGAVSARKGIAQLFNGDPDKTMVDVRKLIRESAQDAGDSAKEIDMYERMVDVAYKTLTGQRVYNQTVMKIAQANNMFAQATLGMTMGFAQIPEMANIVCRSGFQAAFEQFNLRDFISTFGMGFRKSRMKSEVDELSSCIETFTGIAGDHSRGDHFMRRMDDIGFDDTEFTSTTIGKVFDTGRLVSVLNPFGVMPMDTMMRRWASRASFQHFMNTAFSIAEDGKVVLKRSWWRNSKERFAQLGMNEDDVNRIVKVLRNPDYVKYQRGHFGRYKVKSFDFSKVKDQEIVDKFVMALRRSTDSMVQRQTFSEMPAWMNTEFGKLFSQFRVFAVVAKSKQLAAGLARADAYELANVVGGAGLATLGYVMQTYYRSLGQADPERYWEDKTGDNEKLIRSAIMRSGYSTIFPSLIDLASKQTTGHGIFDSSGRTTGQAVDPLEGSTLYSNYSKIKELTSATMAAVFQDRQFTQQDWRHLQGLVWAAKIPALDQLINTQLISKAPISNR